MNQAKKWNQAQVWVQVQERCDSAWCTEISLAVDGRLVRWVQEGLRWLALAWPALPDSV